MLRSAFASKFSAHVVDAFTMPPVSVSVLRLDTPLTASSRHLRIVSDCCGNAANRPREIKGRYKSGRASVEILQKRASKP